MIYKNRRQAGNFLGEKLKSLNLEDPYVLGIARGGVVVAEVVAKVLGCPFGAVVARKLHTLSNEELAFGAIAGTDIEVLDYDLIRTLGVDPEEIASIESKERSKLIKQNQEFSPRYEDLDLNKKTVIVVDDGVATGLTALAAIKFLKTLKPKRLVFGTPVCSTDWEARMDHEADKLVCLFTPNDFLAVGQFYNNFPQINDDTVTKLLINQK